MHLLAAFSALTAICVLVSRVGPSRPPSECAQSRPSARYKGFLGSARTVTRLLPFSIKRGKRSASRPDRLTPRERTTVTH